MNDPANRLPGCLSSIVLRSGLLAFVAVAGWAATAYSAAGQDWVLLLNYGYAIAILSLITGLARGGVFRLPFLITLIMAYPALTPLAVQSGLNLPFFSAWATQVQTPQFMSTPVVLTSTVALSFALFLPSHSFRPKVPAPPRDYTEGELALLAWLTLFFAWLTEPGQIVGIASYAEIRSQRIEGTNFAGGAWIVSAVLLIGMSIRNNSSVISLDRSWRVKPGRYLAFGALLLSSLWLLLHARRSELAGLILLATLLSRARRQTATLLGVLLAVALLGAVGYFRSSGRILPRLGSEYLQLPGAPGNVMVGWMAAYHVSGMGLLEPLRGETYLGHMLRIPPAFLGLSRPPIAQEYVGNLVPNKGGEFFLLEPFINFGIPGAIVFSACLLGAYILSARHIRLFFTGQGRLINYALAASLVAMSFRTFWYGIGAIIKTLIIAGLMTTGLEVLRIAGLRPVRETDSRL